MHKRAPRTARRAGVRRATALAAILVFGPARSATDLADQPVFTINSVPGNVALALSVEFPTAVSVAHQGAFVAGKEYVGYFDPEKCYKYQQGTEVGNDLSHFYPVSTAVSRKCTASGFTDTWSGNFLNWLTMQAIDPFRWALTGGLRVVDTATTTILERAWATSNANNGSDTNFPPIPTSNADPLKARPSPSSTDIADHTPLDFSSLKVSVRTRGNKVRFTKDGDPSSGTPTHYSQSLTLSASTVYEFYVRVKVCTSGTGFSVEDNCYAYGSNYKPEGLLQQYADRMRFSAFGYLNDPTDSNRDGGVLRARQKYVGPNLIRPGQTTIANTAREWDPSTGIFVTNPDTTDASDTNTDFGVTVSNSGVINYVNKFGQEQKTYKRRDPVSELYYGVLRYLKNQGPVPAWTAGVSGDTNKTRLVDGFPVITRWDDPMQFSCQRNFVVGIGDTNTNWDRNLPGSTVFNNEPALPAEITADTSVDAQVATDKVGKLNSNGTNTTLGTTGVSNGSYLIAGLAYDANVNDIRPDDVTKPQTIGKQTVKTYWLDVLEFGSYLKNNQYYLATKFGGFKVPRNFNPATQTTDLPQAWWTTTATTVGSGSSSQPRPDTYYTVADPSQMISGLRSAFASIASDLRAYTTSFATALPRVAYDGVASYATTYDASGWTGDLVASTVTFDLNTGEPTITDAWSFRAKLATQLAGTGWNTGRRVITFNPTTSAGIPFRSTDLTASQLTALDTVYRTGNDSSDYLNYLRGDTTNEVGSTATGSARIYRYREALVGDIVNSKARPVGPPSAPFSTATNPGYSTFKTTYASRPTVVYFGTNAGMLHAVYGALTGSTAGTELFAYVPNFLFSGPTATPEVNGLQSVGDPDYTHHSMVDASPVAFDVDFGRTQGGSGTADWRTVLVGGMGKGGKGYYALDITNPAGMTTEATAAAKVLWEFTDTDLGYTYGEPALVKTTKYGWVLIFGSGYNNSDGIGYFFIVNPRTGALIEKISTGAGGSGVDAGLAHVQAFVLDRTDGTADTVYGADLLGNIWRLDLRGSPTGSYPAPLKLAELKDSGGTGLPVTSRPLVVVQPGTNLRFVTVGTGRLLASSDTSSTQTQGFFAIMDGTGLAPGTSAKLPSGVTYPIQKSNLKELTDLTKKISVDPASQVGWWINLGNGTGSLGWRHIVEPTSFNGIVAFTSMLPSGDVCSPAGSSRVYAVDLGTGQSKLLNGSGDTVAYLNSLTGFIADLRFLSVSTKPRLIAGSDKGEVKNQSGNWSTGLGVRRLNWRELPLAD